MSIDLAVAQRDCDTHVGVTACLGVLGLNLIIISNGGGDEVSPLESKCSAAHLV